MKPFLIVLFLIAAAVASLGGMMTVMPGVPFQGTLPPATEDEERIAENLRADVETLDALRQRLAPYSGGVKRAGGWLAEKLLRLKLTRTSDVKERLALFESLEMLSLGIQGKRAMWALLGELSTRNHELAGHEYGVLELRAVDQFHQVEAARLALGRELFTETYAEETL